MQLDLIPIINDLANTQIAYFIYIKKFWIILFVVNVLLQLTLIIFILFTNKVIINSHGVSKICSNPYDLDRHLPMILCKDLHYCCLPCSDQILSTEILQRKCPDCRTTITKATVVKFRHYTNLLEQAKAQERKIEILESSASLLP